LKTGGVAYLQAQPVAVGQQPEAISASTGINPAGLKAPGATSKAKGESEWVDPHEKAKKEEEDQHLLKPSDFFGS